MIQILDKHKCCGCSACEQICPKQCISFRRDQEGFVYPFVNNSICINCGLCERVCPVINLREDRLPLKTFAATNNNEEIRRNSSSGGVFSALAEKTICKGGKVYGARFQNDLSVVHCKADTLDGIAQFRGSKYLQSELKDIYKAVRNDLNKGIEVLFSGTPCQIAGLKLFLQKNYENLIAVDFVCHGVPSPTVWQSYLDLFRKETEVTSVSFRNKEFGWHRFGVFSDNHYMQVFLSNISLRPSCYQCPTKKGRSGSDITLGDFWGIENINPEIDDDKGISLLLVNTKKGEIFCNNLDIWVKEENYQYAVKYNPSIEYSVPESFVRTKFFSVFANKGFDAAYKSTMIPPLSRRVISKIKTLIKKIFGEKGKKIVRILRDK